VCRILPLLLASAFIVAAPRGGSAQAVDWSAVDTAFGRTSATGPDGVHRFSMPRTDLTVSVEGVTVAPALALGSWVAMKPRTDGSVVAMGDLVLTESEVEPVLTKLQQGGVMQTALHNHLLFETPRVMFVHVYAEGDGTHIARTIRAALALTGTPDAGSAGQERPLALDTAAIASTLGHHGSVGGGVYKISAPRQAVVRVNGEEIPPSMGLATAIGFQPTGGGNAAATGDFVLAPSEVNPVIRALRENGIAVTALHNHLLFDDPHLFFMHFWGNGDAVEIARGLRAALALMAVR